MSTLKNNFFVSYTTIDSQINRVFLTQLSCVLSNYGKTFIDLIDNDSTNKQSRVEYELCNSNAMILILTENVFKSQWVNKEIRIAKENSIPIYKVEYERIMMTDFSTLKATTDNIANELR